MYHVTVQGPRLKQFEGWDIESPDDVQTNDGDTGVLIIQTAANPGAIRASHRKSRIVAYAAGSWDRIVILEKPEPEDTAPPNDPWFARQLDDLPSGSVVQIGHPANESYARKLNGVWCRSDYYGVVKHDDRGVAIKVDLDPRDVTKIVRNTSVDFGAGATR